MINFPSWPSLHSLKFNSRITHGPPLRVLDRTRRGVSAGCPALAKRLDTSLPHCRLHIFGHIHEARGAVLRYRQLGDGLSKVVVPTIFVNAAGRGQRGVQPIIVDLLNLSLSPETTDFKGVDTLDSTLREGAIV